jgi:hypothetical protein
MPQPADFGGFCYTLASNLLAYCAVMAAICQRSPPPLPELPTLGNRLATELQQNPPDLNLSFKMADFYMKKGLANISLGLNYCSMGSSITPMIS